MAPWNFLIAIIAQQALGQQPFTINAPQSPPAGASESVPRDVSSFSIEFSTFVDYAGNASHPNEYSRALLANLKDTTGIFPRIRVGGMTQDRSLYEPSQEKIINSTYAKPSDDQPVQVTYGPSFFDAWHNLGGIEYSYGLNLAYNNSDKASRLASTAATACKKLGPLTLRLLELGNEPDFYIGVSSWTRSPNWTMAQYVGNWNTQARDVANAVKEHCPDQDVGFISPSFSWTNFTGAPPWNPVEAFALGLDTSLIKEIAVHNYMNTDSKQRFGLENISLQSLLMNHTSVVGSLAVHLELASNLSYLGLPYTLGETNAMALQGGGITYSMSNALWMVDFALWTAANNIKCINFHQGTGYRYSSWQPIEASGKKPSTRPPYYAQMMLAHTIANTTEGTNTRIANLKLPNELDSAYAIYDDDIVARLVVINMETYSSSNNTSRPSKTFAFRVPQQFGSATVQRLMGADAHSRTNITFGSVSYDYELQGGKPVVVDPEARDEQVHVEDGIVRVEVPASSAVLLRLN